MFKIIIDGILHKRRVGQLSSFFTPTCIIIGLYDLWMASYYGVDHTISRYLQVASFDTPTVPFTIGYICGHIFGYMKPKKEIESLKEHVKQD